MKVKAMSIKNKNFAFLNEQMKYSPTFSNNCFISFDKTLVKYIMHVRSDRNCKLTIH